MTDALRVCGIDPGTDTLGICYLDIDLDTFAITLYDVKTITAHLRRRDYDHLREEVGNRFINVKVLQDYVYRSLVSNRPHVLMAEAPYSGRFATAFSALVEVNLRLRDALWAYDPSMTYYSIDPKSVKKFIGAAVHKATKDNMKLSLMKVSDINWNGFDLIKLDEHSIDAIAVGYYKAKQLIGFIKARGG